MVGLRVWEDDSRLRFAASVRSMLRWAATGPRSTSWILPRRSGSRGFGSEGETTVLEVEAGLGIGVVVEQRLAMWESMYFNLFLSVPVTMLICCNEIF